MLARAGGSSSELERPDRWGHPKECQAQSFLLILLTAVSGVARRIPRAEYERACPLGRRIIHNRKRCIAVRAVLPNDYLREKVKRIRIGDERWVGEQGFRDKQVERTPIRREHKRKRCLRAGRIIQQSRAETLCPDAPDEVQAIAGRNGLSLGLETTVGNEPYISDVIYKPPTPPELSAIFFNNGPGRS